MLRLVLLVLYLIASSSSPASQMDRGGGWDPLGLDTSPPPPQTDRGSGWDPFG